MSVETSGRGSTWSDEEVLLLLGFWGEEAIQSKLDNCVHKRPVFEKIAKYLAEQGYQHTHKQINEKIKQLKKKYKETKDANNLSGRNRTSFKYFEKMDEILGDRPIARPFVLFEVEAPSDGGDNDNEGLSSSSSDVMPSDEYSNNSYLQSDQDSVVEPSSQVDPVQIMSSVADSEGSEASHEQANMPQAGKQAKNTMACSSRRGRNKKRSRNEAMFNSAIEMLKEQQKEADERLCKMEEARRKEEVAAEEKRRKEDREHSIFMMQMMGRMFMQAVTTVHSPSPMPQTQPGAYYSQTGGINTVMYTQDNQSDSFDVNNERQY